MPTSIRNQVLDAVVALLNTGRPGEVPEFRRERPNPTQQLAAGNVCLAPIPGPQETSETVPNKRGPLTVRHLLVAVEVWNVGATSVCLDSALIWITGQLAGSRLGGLVHWTEERQTQWARAALDEDYWRATVVFDVEYQTARGNLTATA